MSEIDPLQSAIVTPPQAASSASVAAHVAERLEFDSVLKEELDYIERRRINIEQSSELNNKDTFALAFSGGGIRSASFNLGVLQAFAEKKLLGSLDYLSTVSGGGYIGSWLAAWLHRDGDIDRVEKLLTPNRKTNVVDGRKFSEEDARKSKDNVFDDEPTPLFHLRAYSSYLTPKPGFLSVQSWTLFAIYLRNVFLNLLVIIPFSVMIILAIVFALKVYMVNEYWVVFGYLSFVFCIPCFVFAAVWIARSIEDVRNNLDEGKPRAPDAPPADATERRPRFAKSYVPAVIAIVSGCFFLATACHRQKDQWMELTYNSLGTFWSWSFIAVWCILMGFLHTSVNHLSWKCLIRRRREKPEERKKRKEDPGLWLLSSFVAGFLLALLCLMSLWSMESIRDYEVFGITIEKESIRLILIVPLLLLSMGVAETMQVGVLGRLEEPIVRDKWSACNAYCALAGAAWFGLFFVVLILPEIFYLPDSTWAKFAGPVGWAASSIATAFLAYSPTSNGKKSGWTDWLVQLGPPIFLIGLIVGLSTIVYRWLLQPHADVVAPKPELNWNSVYWIYAVLFLLGTLMITAIGSRLIDVNIFSLQELYQNRLVRTFLGASRPRAQRCGAPFVSNADQRYPDPITDLDGGDDIVLSKLVGCYDHKKPEQCTDVLPPILLINTSMNRVGDISLNNQERLAESFTLGSLHCGCPTTKFIRTCDGYGDNIRLGTAFAISGAAVAPNMGYYSSPVVTALLTLFNLRLGAWLGNPLRDSFKPVEGSEDWFHELLKLFRIKPKGTAKDMTETSKPADETSKTFDETPSSADKVWWTRKFEMIRPRVKEAAKWTAKKIEATSNTTLKMASDNVRKFAIGDGDPALSAGPQAGWLHLFREMLGLTTIRSEYIYLSDGGHFDNLGVYELLQRRCRYIVACDAGEDPDGSCNELAMIIRKAFIDFGIEIKIDVDALRVDPTTNLSKRRFAIGKITYPPRSIHDEPEFGHFVYVKMTLDGTESADIRSYKVKHPEFPHRTTADQFFTESKFESFRKLGYEIAKEMLNVNASNISAHAGCNDQLVRMRQAKLHRYLDEIAAYGSMNLGPDWIAKNQELGLRYEELQSRLVSNRNLRHLRAEIEKRTELFQLIDRIASCETSDAAEIASNPEIQHQMASLRELFVTERIEQENYAEGEWIAKATNLLSDVFETIGLTEYNPMLRKGWIRIARRWMLTSSFEDHWENWKEDYPKVMYDFYEELKDDGNWNPKGPDSNPKPTKS